MKIIKMTKDDPPSTSQSQPDVSELLRVLTQLLTSQSQPVSKPDPFDETVETFDTYMKRFNTYLATNKLENKSDPEKVNLLIDSLNPKTHQILVDLTAPDEPNKKTFAQIQTLLTNHFNPVASVIVERHRFLLRQQELTETVAQYVAELKKIAARCDFTCQNCKKSTADDHLKSQFTRGVKDDAIRIKLLAEADPHATTFEQAVKNAVVIEASQAESKELKTDRKPENTQSVNKIGNKKSETYRNYRSKSRQNPNDSRNNHRNAPKKNHHSSDPDNQGKCLRCGLDNHTTDKCKLSRSVRCHKCNKNGHLSRICQSSKRNADPASKTEKKPSNSERTNYIAPTYDDFDGIFGCGQVRAKFSLQKPEWDIIEVTLIVNGVDFLFEVDTGSPITIIPKSKLKGLKLPNARKNEDRFCEYLGKVFQPELTATVQVTYRNVTETLPLYIVDDDEAQTLVGREWLRKLGMTKDILNFSKVNNVTSVPEAETLRIHLMEKFSDTCTQKVGKIPNAQCSLILKEDAKPIFIKPRPLPYSLEAKVNDELEKMQKEGIIEKTENCPWGTPLVPVEKSDGSIRVCANYKLTVNPQLKEYRYPMPSSEYIFNRLRGKYFCIFDIYRAYLHYGMDAASAAILALSTHLGTFLVWRLFFGVAIAPNAWQDLMDKLIADLEGTSVYIDDFVVSGNTVCECFERVKRLFEKLAANDIHINLRKSKFFCTEIVYLGYKIDQFGLHKADEKVRDLLDAPRPENADDVRCLVGMVNYYAKFIPDAASILHPLTQLLHKNAKFAWNGDCEAAFRKIKMEIASDRVLVPYSTMLPVTLATDASPYGLSGVLSHVLNHQERPIAFASRSLTKAEAHYSQIDREATAVVWAIKKFYQYLYGRKFTLIVDNKPLTFIFNPSKDISTVTASRLVRYAMFLSGFDYIVEHRKAEHHKNADYLSRAPRKCDNNALDTDSVINVKQIRTISDEIINAKRICEEISKDPDLSILRDNLFKGEETNPEFCLEFGMILKGQRVVIPKTLQPQILRQLHSAHIGVVRMKKLARRFCWWRGIDNDIEKLVKSCSACCLVQKNPKQITHHWEAPTKKFERIHMDYAGPVDNFYFFVIIDSFTKWPEIIVEKHAPTSDSTIKNLSEFFGRFGNPQMLVSDNATIFKSTQFVEFCRQRGIQQRFCAPGHPATNGQAEIFVQILKKALKTMIGPIPERVSRFLQKYRSTPLSSSDDTPSERLYGVNIRTEMDLLTYREPKNDPEQIDNRSADFAVGNRVQSCNYVGEKWKFGTISKTLGKAHFMVKLDDGYELKRNSNQLRKCNVPPPVSDPNPRIQRSNLRTRSTIFPAMEERRTADQGANDRRTASQPTAAPALNASVSRLPREL
ncbi:uncharacterized protein K02A2.6-like [Planococcus citri]|uniref:uncharacterized protein K02A2.6-like n=1 Tax=Planococcus citri TaxID=170843 RepID=UPI0031F8847E